MIQGFDMDGVLAVGPPPPKRPWRFLKGTERKEYKDQLIHHYRSALPIIVPRGTFHVITARKNTPTIFEETRKWLTSRYPGQLIGLHMLTESRTLENVIAFKAEAIRSAGVTDFTEDNLQVVKGLRKVLPKVRIWLYKDGICSI